MNKKLKNWFLNSGSAFDADAVTYFTAAGITDPTQKTAWNNFVVGAKPLGLWTTAYAYYPILGGVASSHLVNAKNPGTYNLTFHGGITHSSNGMQGNGSTGYAQTGFIPSVASLLNNDGFSCYVRTSNTNNGFDMYTRTGFISGVGYFGGANNISIENIVFGGLSLGTSGLFTLSTTANAVHKVYKGGAQVATDGTASGGLPTGEYYLLASNENNVAGVFSDRQMAFAAIHQGPTAQQAADLYTLVQAFQTALGRNV